MSGESMIESKIILNSSGPGLDSIRRLMDDIQSDLVLVGISEDKAPRKGDKEISNAQLMYIHTNGSPINKIPARPVIEPAIEASGNKEEITEELGKAFQFALDGKKTNSTQHLKRAGQLAVNAARDWFEDTRNNWPPNSPQTAMRKISKLKGKKKKAALAQLASGEASESVSRPLVDTGQLRRAITYVVTGKND